MSEFPFTLGPEGNIFPLSGNPYWSRVNLFEIQGATAKNYAFLGFKPGLPLQASELNEIQEIKSLNDTLTATMYSSWPVYLPSHTGSNPLYGPGWNGTTPLYPQFDGENTTVNMVGYTGNVISIREGWYLVTVKTSNLKHWVYLESGYTRAIPTGITTNYLGFTAYYETVKPTQDPSLYDNSTGINLITGAAAGADRIKVTILPPFWTTDKSSPNFSPITKKIDTDADIMYMNNVPVPKE
jgi:hypothetical protein